MYRVPAMKRILADPNIQKLTNCPCWSIGWVQSKSIKIIFSELELGPLLHLTLNRFKSGRSCIRS